MCDSEVCSEYMYNNNVVVTTLHSSHFILAVAPKPKPRPHIYTPIQQETVDIDGEYQFILL